MRNEHNDNDFGEIVRCFYEMDNLVDEAFSGLLYDDDRKALRERVAKVLREKPEYASHFLTSDEQEGE